MTIGAHEMRKDEESGFIDAMDRINSTCSAIKSIAWALGGMAACGLAVAGWVWTVNNIQSNHDNELKELRPKVADLEKRAVRLDATPSVTVTQLYDLDKRLARNEDKLQSIVEQNAMILSELRKIQN